MNQRLQAEWTPDTGHGMAAWSMAVEYVEGARPMSVALNNALFVLALALDLPQHEVVPFVETTIEYRA